MSGARGVTPSRVHGLPDGPHGHPRALPTLGTPAPVYHRPFSPSGESRSGDGVWTTSTGSCNQDVSFCGNGRLLMSNMSLRHHIISTVKSKDSPRRPGLSRPCSSPEGG